MSFLGMILVVSLFVVGAEAVVHVQLFIISLSLLLYHYTILTEVGGVA